MICEEAEAARILTLNEIMEEYEGHVIWMQVKEKITVWPVKYSHMIEDAGGKNWLAFDGVERKGDHYYLRPTLMGKTWVMWSDKPTGSQRREALRRG